MRVFVDTSAIYASFDNDDDQFSTSQQIWRHLLDTKAFLITTNYVILETNALLQRRFGMEAVKDMEIEISPFLSIRWVDEQSHEAGISAMLMTNRRRLSLVDCVSFVVCRELNIREVFGFDPHFQEQGFRLLSLMNLG